MTSSHFVAPVLQTSTMTTSVCLDVGEDGAFLQSALTAGPVCDFSVAVFTGKGMDLDWRTMH